ncbi:hypothetical protein MFIFM68171_06375 [Madurella fahalii]|uniref:Uncharacterized protein n=1 Tax=Madurella fahalii TaxID=1157608 RepID=A0ABQ0GEP0_9PEZI
MTDQRRAVETQEMDIQLLQEADTIVDVEQLTGITMQEEAKKLTTVRHIMDDLHCELDESIDSWGRLSLEERREEQLPWPKFPEPPTAPALAPARGQRPLAPAEDRTPRVTDPSVGTKARYVEQWNRWAGSPTVHNPAAALGKQTPWWMKEQTQYALSKRPEEDQLEGSAAMAQFNRGYVVGLSFAREIKNARQRRTYPEPRYRAARNSSEDIFLDEDYDPLFWQKNLRPGNIWTGPPRFQIPEEDNISPRTVPPSFTRRDLQVGRSQHRTSV